MGSGDESPAGFGAESQGFIISGRLGCLKRFSRAAALVVAVIMVLCAGQPVGVFASSLSEMKSKKSGISKDINALKSQLNSTLTDKNNTAYEISRLDIEMEEAQIYYDYYCELMEWVVRELEMTEAELARARQDYEEQFEAFSNRVRYLNENDQSGLGYLQILLSSSSISDFLNNVEIIKVLTEYDKTLTDQLKATEEYIAEKYEEVELYLREIEEAKIEQERYVAELEEKYQEKQRKLEELYFQEAYYNEMISDMQKDSDSLEKLIKEAEAAELARQKAANSSATQTVYQGGILGWPVPSSSTISSYYGNRTHPITKKPDFHNGIDIPAPKGNNVVASGDGKVIFAGTNGSYGKIVVVDHGGGISTAYAHNSSIVVSVGQSVVKGQTIAKIGSTGQSTGNHCHFEVRVNGKAVDPLGYVKGK